MLRELREATKSAVTVAFFHSPMFPSNDLIQSDLVDNMIRFRCRLHIGLLSKFEFAHWINNVLNNDFYPYVTNENERQRKKQKEKLIV